MVTVIFIEPVSSLVTEILPVTNKVRKAPDVKLSEQGQCLSGMNPSLKNN